MADYAPLSQLFFIYLINILYCRDRKECPGLFHGHLVKLYADYAPAKLLAFLKTSDQYPIQEALGETASSFPSFKVF